MGNICRSPTAHGVMQRKLDSASLNKRIMVDSAGTHAYHIGEKSDARSREKARSKGIDMEFIRARKISTHDYHTFDYLLAMDQDNLDLVRHHAPQDYKAEIRLFLDFAGRQGLTSQVIVPDPYYDGDEGFDEVFELVELGCNGLINHILNSDESHDD
jgi:protein-tyrosine phosphatase